jgi:DNA gyrase subunit B
MHEIIERGHLYIAQPPLYKATEGRKSTYLKDDREYRQYLIDRIQGSWSVDLYGSGGNGSGGSVSGSNGSDGELFKGDKLGRFLERVDRFRDDLARLVGRGFPAEALAIALEEQVLGREDLADEDKIRRVAARLSEVERFSDVEIGYDEEHSLSTVSFGSRQDGVERTATIDLNLLAIGEYRSLAKNDLGRRAAATSRFVLTKDDETLEFEDLDTMVETLYAGARKGVSVQRYKGLGEMNADQLWETTMDPTARNLLQVRIEDAVGADEIFTVLMGDQVEPRRDFIVDNALEVKNLDV